MSPYETATLSCTSPPCAALTLKSAMRTSLKVIVMKVCWPSPDLAITSVALSKCLPLAQALASVGEALSNFLVRVTMPGDPLPTDEPPPTVQVALCTFQLQLMSSISSLWSLCTASPLTPSILKWQSIILVLQSGLLAMRPGCERNRVPCESPRPAASRTKRPRGFQRNRACPSAKNSAYLPPLADGSFDTSRSETVRPSSW